MKRELIQNQAIYDEEIICKGDKFRQCTFRADRLTLMLDHHHTRFENCNFNCEVVLDFNGNGDIDDLGKQIIFTSCNFYEHITVKANLIWEPFNCKVKSIDYKFDATRFDLLKTAKEIGQISLVRSRSLLWQKVADAFPNTTITIENKFEFIGQEGDQNIWRRLSDDLFFIEVYHLQLCFTGGRKEITKEPFFITKKPFTHTPEYKNLRWASNIESLRKSSRDFDTICFENAVNNKSGEKLLYFSATDLEEPEDDYDPLAPESDDMLPANTPTYE